VSLGEVRRIHAHWREITKTGTDPIAVRDREKRAASRADTSFKTVAQACFEAKQAGLKGDGKAGRWLSPLTHHVFPKLGRVPVQDITQRDIELILKPIWHEKADTARKALNRIGMTLKHAAAMGIDVDMQATEKAKALLGQSRHVPTGHKFLPWQELPALYAQLGEAPADLALRLNILLGGGVRSAPIRLLHIRQIDGDTWTVPGDDMKGRKNRTPEFRVPLSSEAQRVLESAKALERDGYLFPGQGRVAQINQNAMLNRMRALGGVTAHGLRKSFRSWAADTGKPYDVAETCLAHAVGSQIERTYQKSDLLPARRILLEQWAAVLTGSKAAVLTFPAMA
jgi:integrase